MGSRDVEAVESIDLGTSGVYRYGGQWSLEVWGPLKFRGLEVGGWSLDVYGPVESISVYF